VNYQPAGRDRYTLTRLHAKGGIGQLWLARDSDLGREHRDCGRTNLPCSVTADAWEGSEAEVRFIQ
jgi:hypothetical protein